MHVYKKINSVFRPCSPVAKVSTDCCLPEALKNDDKKLVKNLPWAGVEPAT
jgi:hypothetical protein